MKTMKSSWKTPYSPWRSRKSTRKSIRTRCLGGITFINLLKLQAELIKMHDWVQAAQAKVLVIFEGRDSAGKGGVIKRITQRLNPRVCRVVALPKPTEREQNPVVLSAICASPALRRRNCLVRSLLVQPGRGRAGDGFCHRATGGRLFPRCG